MDQPLGIKSRYAEFLITLRVGFFLALRELKRSNIWTTILIIMVMVLTFLNLIVISGILVGLIQGSVVAYTDRYLGDVFITTLPQKAYVQNSQQIISFVKSIPQVTSVSARYTSGAHIEANYLTRLRQTDLVDKAGGIASGIDPVAEDNFSHLSKYIVEGEYLKPDDYDQILVGADLLYKYTPIDSPDMVALKNVGAGSKVRLVINGITREVTIKGVLRTKVGEIDQRVFMVDTQFRNLINRFDYNVGEIAIKLKPGASPEQIRDLIKSTGADQFARIQTAAEAEPKFIKDIESTFAILGNLISSIGLAVACITIFIVVFVNAITRRRYIGILKGIGIDSRAIEISYILQSLFYAVVGMILGSIFVFAFLKPYLNVHPIDFPFSDGILVATFTGTFIRAIILSIATIVAGFIPARIVVKQNTLDAILGR